MYQSQKKHLRYVYGFKKLTITVYDQLIEQKKKKRGGGSFIFITKFFIIKISRKVFWQDPFKLSCRAKILQSDEFILLSYMC